MVRPCVERIHKFWLVVGKVLFLQREAMATRLLYRMQRMRILCGPLVLAALLAPSHASTLLQLTLDDMIGKSTMIVRGKVQQQTYADFQGHMIWTHYTLQVSETLKGSPARQLDIVVPGGNSKGIQQTYSGAPTFSINQDYVMFLWTSKSGLTQVIGLSQGLFAVVPDPAGNSMVIRAAASEHMLTTSGQPVTDSDIQLPLSNLRNRIQLVLSAKGVQ